MPVGGAQEGAGCVARRALPTSLENSGRPVRGCWRCFASCAALPEPASPRASPRLGAHTLSYPLAQPSRRMVRSLARGSGVCALARARIGRIRFALLGGALPPKFPGAQRPPRHRCPTGTGASDRARISSRCRRSRPCGRSRRTRDKKQLDRGSARARRRRCDPAVKRRNVAAGILVAPLHAAAVGSWVVGAALAAGSSFGHLEPAIR